MSIAGEMLKQVASNTLAEYRAPASMAQGGRAMREARDLLRLALPPFVASVLPGGGHKFYQAAGDELMAVLMLSPSTSLDEALDGFRTRGFEHDVHVGDVHVLGIVDAGMGRCICGFNTLTLPGDSLGDTWRDLFVHHLHIPVPPAWLRPAAAERG